MTKKIISILIFNRGEACDGFGKVREVLGGASEDVDVINRALHDHSFPYKSYLQCRDGKWDSSIYTISYDVAKDANDEIKGAILWKMKDEFKEKIDGFLDLLSRKIGQLEEGNVRRLEAKEEKEEGEDSKLSELIEFKSYLRRVQELLPNLYSGDYSNVDGIDDAITVAERDASDFCHTMGFKKHVSDIDDYKKTLSRSQLGVLSMAFGFGMEKTELANYIKRLACLWVSDDWFEGIGVTNPDDSTTLLNACFKLIDPDMYNGESDGSIIEACSGQFKLFLNKYKGSEYSDRFFDDVSKDNFDDFLEQSRKKCFEEIDSIYLLSKSRDLDKCESDRKYFLTGLQAMLSFVYLVRLSDNDGGIMKELKKYLGQSSEEFKVRTIKKRTFEYSKEDVKQRISSIENVPDRFLTGLVMLLTDGLSKIDDGLFWTIREGAGATDVVHAMGRQANGLTQDDLRDDFSKTFLRGISNLERLFCKGICIPNDLCSNIIELLHESVVGNSCVQEYDLKEISFLDMQKKQVGNFFQQEATISTQLEDLFNQLDTKLSEIVLGEGTIDIAALMGIKGPVQLFFTALAQVPGHFAWMESKTGQYDVDTKRVLEKATVKVRALFKEESGKEFNLDDLCRDVFKDKLTFYTDKILQLLDDFDEKSMDLEILKDEVTDDRLTELQHIADEISIIQGRIADREKRESDVDKKRELHQMLEVIDQKMELINFNTRKERIGRRIDSKDRNSPVIFPGRPRAYSESGKLDPRERVWERGWGRESQPDSECSPPSISRRVQPDDLFRIFGKNPDTLDEVPVGVKRFVSLESSKHQYRREECKRDLFNEEREVVIEKTINEWVPRRPRANSEPVNSESAIFSTRGRKKEIYRKEVYLRDCSQKAAIIQPQPKTRNQSAILNPFNDKENKRDLSPDGRMQTGQNIACSPISVSK